MKNIPKIQFIFTFHEKEQLIDTFPFSPVVFNSPKDLIAYAMSQLVPDETCELIKISTCVYNSKDIELPKWYYDCNGKFWLDDLENFRREYDMKTTIPQDYIRDWMSQNA